MLSSCSSPYTPDKPIEEVVEEKKLITYNATLDTNEAWYRSKVKVFGKNFGTHLSSVMVYLGDLSIKPISVEDTCITFIVPSKIEVKEYTVWLRVLDDKVKVKGTLALVSSVWGSISKVELSANLFGIYKPYSGYNDTNTKKSTNLSIEVFPSNWREATYAIEETYPIVSYNIEYKRSSNSTSHTQAQYFSGLEKFTARIDTVKGLVTNLNISIKADGSMVSMNGGYSYSLERVFQLENAQYRMVKEGIEIYVQGKDLENALKKVVYYCTGTGPSIVPEDFTLIPEYKEENFVKILLLRDN